MFKKDMIYQQSCDDTYFSWVSFFYIIIYFSDRDVKYSSYRVSKSKSFKCLVVKMYNFPLYARKIPFLCISRDGNKIKRKVLCNN